LNGAFAVMYVATFLKQSVSSGSWTAATLSAAGALLLIFQHGVFEASLGDVLAFLGAIVYAAYIFAVEAKAKATDDPISVFCIETLVMWALSVIITGVFDGWTLGALSAGSVFTIAYVGIFTTFAPTMIAITMQKFVPAITVAFLYVLEPIWSALLARLYLHETPSVTVFVGGSLIVAGAVLHLAVTSAQARRMPKAAAC
jgi:drug/metabolite transporter (DMT)-like permease